MTPTVSFNSSKFSGAAPLEVTFTSTSSNADQFEWSATAENGETVLFGTGPVAQYTFMTPGEYKVTLKASSLYSSGTFFQNILVGGKAVFGPVATSQIKSAPATTSATNSATTPASLKSSPTQTATGSSSDLASPAAAWKKYSSSKDTFRR